MARVKELRVEDCYLSHFEKEYNCDVYLPYFNAKIDIEGLTKEQYKRLKDFLKKECSFGD